MSVAEAREAAPILAMPPRATRPLSTVQILKVGLTNSLSACDEQMFDELIVERRFFGRPAFVISDPDGVKHVLQDNYDNYPRLDQSRRIFHFGSGTGMLCAEGDAWRRHRRLINPTLDYRAIQADMPALVGFVEDVVRHLAAVPAGEEIDIGKVVARFISAATRHLFAGGDRRITPMVEELAHYPGKLSLFDVLPVPASLGFVARYFGGRAVAQQFEPMLRELISERRSEDYAGSNDMMWRLTQARDRSTGDSLSDAELCDEAFTLANTAVTPLRVLSWIWYLLALHPTVEQRLHAEIDEVLGGQVPAWEDLPKLVYLRQVVDETMRLYPPLPVMMRTVAEDDTVCGWRIQIGRAHV